MSNPFTPPAPSTDAEDPGYGLARKPKRVWFFQALLVLQLGGAVVATASSLASPDVRGLPPSDFWLGLLRPLVGIPIVTALIGALERLGPKPRFVAPALALLWWLLSVAAYSFLVPVSEPEVVRALKFDDAPSAPRWVTALTTGGLLLWFVVSTWSHPATRYYLAQARRPTS